MKYFSKNIVFVDTEFSTLDPYQGEILSIALIKLNGEELYLELEYSGDCSLWVKEHVLPMLTELKISREEAVKRIQEFVGDSKPYTIGYVNQFDVIYGYKLTLQAGDPFYWLPIDFASILFANGINPENYLDFAKELKIDVSKFKLHHALDDARLLREVYIKSIEKF